jgi:excisionase family DNA binding protein
VNPMLTPPAGLEPLLNARQVAAMLGVPLSWVYDNAGSMPVFRVGKLPRFRASEVEAWLERQRQRPTYDLREAPPPRRWPLRESAEASSEVSENRPATVAAAAASMPFTTCE